MYMNGTTWLIYYSVYAYKRCNMTHLLQCLCTWTVQHDSFVTRFMYMNSAIWLICYSVYVHEWYNTTHLLPTVLMYTNGATWLIYYSVYAYKRYNATHLLQCWCTQKVQCNSFITFFNFLAYLYLGIHTLKLLTAFSISIFMTNINFLPPFSISIFCEEF
jgi:hypothetical protein